MRTIAEKTVDADRHDVRAETLRFARNRPPEGDQDSKIIANRGDCECLVIPGEEFGIQIHTPIETGISELGDPEENKRLEDIKKGFADQIEIICQRNLCRLRCGSLRGEGKPQSGKYRNS